jgi:ABC-2 type transport system permease protein
MLLAGLGFAAGYGKETGPILGACLVQLPAVWVIGGAAVLLHGVLPRAAMAAWGVAGAALLIGWVGPALNLPQAVLDVSPFGHVPKLPGGGMEWGPVLALTGIAVVLVTVRLAGVRSGMWQRDRASVRAVLQFLRAGRVTLSPSLTLWTSR